MDYKEEQAGEIEALKSIYEGDLEGNIFRKTLECKYSESFPNLTLDSFKFL